MKFISVPVFIASLCIGIFLSYITLPRPHTVYVYPTPDNLEKIQYEDEAGTCFGFTSHQIKCPKNRKDVREYPIQMLKDNNY